MLGAQKHIQKGKGQESWRARSAQAQAHGFQFSECKVKFSVSRSDQGETVSSRLPRWVCLRQTELCPDAP